MRRDEGRSPLERRLRARRRPSTEAMAVTSMAWASSSSGSSPGSRSASMVFPPPGGPTR